MAINKVKLEDINTMKRDNEEQLKNTINSILAEENWIEFVRTATCNYRSGKFYNLKKYNCYEWYREIDEIVDYGILTEPLYEYIKDKEAREELKQAYDNTGPEDWDGYNEKEIEIMSNLDADKLEMRTDWEVKHIYEINEIEYLDEEQSQVIVARAHCNHNWKKSYLVYDINKEEIEEVIK